jgi:ABC-2 type transport system permease protein
MTAMKARFAFAPGSALWLLSHEARLLYYGTAPGSAAEGSGKRRGISRGSMVWWITLTLLLHAGAGFVMHSMPPVVGAAPVKLAMLLAGILALVFTLMLSMGLKTSVEALFERGDLDLLLSSPLSSRSIFTVRLTTVVLGVAGTFLFFLAPFAHAGLVLGQPRWLTIYPVFVSMALVAASVSMLLTLGLVQWLGVRRTRVVAQVLGALAGAAIFLVSQLFASFGAAMQGRIQNYIAPLFRADGMLGPASVAWVPGQALLGQATPLLGMTVFGMAAFWFTTHLTHAFFVRGVQHSGAVANNSRRPAGALKLHFRSNLTHTILIKEWRLVARDPQLISQVLLQLLYLLPLLGLVFVSQSPLPGIASGMTFLCGSLATALAWIVIAAEDAPDLLLNAPANPATIRRAKLAAVIIPPLALAAPGLAWIAIGQPAGALLMAACVAGAVANAALIALWCGRPSVRGQFKRRAKGNLINTTLETSSGFAWAGVAFLSLKGNAAAEFHGPSLVWPGLVLGMAFGILCLAWIMRRRD